MTGYFIPMRQGYGPKEVVEILGGAESCTFV
jgi:hypothetical protein